MPRLKRSHQQKNDHSQKQLDNLLMKYGSFEELDTRKKVSITIDSQSAFSLEYKKIIGRIYDIKLFVKGIDLV